MIKRKRGPRGAKEGKMQNSGQMIRLTGLWDRGKGIFSGAIGPTASLVIMPNKLKKSSSDPDAIAYLQAPAGRMEQPKEAGRPAEPEMEQPSFWWEK